MKNSTLPSIQTHFADWYNDVVYKAELADHSPVKGSVIIRPYGYALWEEVKTILDKKIKSHGVPNAAFPLFIPLSFLQKEAEHVAGFSPELAIVTHAGGKELEEPYVVRPTSETIIHYMFAQWIKSWRDLPYCVNQWANVVRWEMRTRPFLRTTEFFWQEGHTAHETAQEAETMAENMWREYIDMYENYLAIPVVAGLKSEQEKFAGADKTYTVEGMMPDGKALQLCTSHLISQNFAKSFNMTFQNKEGKQAYPYLTSWGFTTRSVGAVVMMHGDQKGLILPPRVAPIQVVIVPIIKKGSDTALIERAVTELKNALMPHVRVHIDNREHETPGAKFFEWELKGVPLRIEIGQRDVEQQSVVVVERLSGTKHIIAQVHLVEHVVMHLANIQKALFERAHTLLKNNWHTSSKLIDFSEKLEHSGGFYEVGWCGASECENILKEHKATIRCRLREQKALVCFACEAKACYDVLVAKAY